MRLPPFQSACAVAFVALASPASARAGEPDRVAACADAAERGQELRSARKLVDARPLFVACAQRECPTAVRDSCVEWLAELDRRLPSIVVSAKDPDGRDVGGVVVTLDGAALPATVTSTAYAVDPGPHRLRAEAPGREPASEDVILREGEPLRVLSLVLPAAESAGAHRDGSRHGDRPFPVVPVVLGATSLVALGAFAFFGATGASDYRGLERTCAPDCASARADGVRTKFLIADVALVVAVVSGVAAGALLVFDRPRARPAGR